MLSAPDRLLIAEAVALAEASTSGEIVCVLARTVSDYAEIPLIWGAAAALILPPLVVAAGLDPLATAHLTGAWTAGHSAAAGATLAAVLAPYALAQAVIFAVVAALAWIPPVRRLLTPAGLKRRRVGDAALAQLAAAALAAGPGRAAVVIFACEADRMVEIRATQAVHAKADDALWNSAVAAVRDGMRRGAAAEGFVQAVELCAGPLARHFPSQGPDGNSAPNEPLEL